MITSMVGKRQAKQTGYLTLRVQLLNYFNRLSRELFNDPIRRFQGSFVLLILLNGFGTVMYMLLEDWELVDAFYMTVITIATVGYGEVRELSSGGRIFTIILIYLGVGAATTALTNAISLALGPIFWSNLQLRRMHKMIDEMQDHYIVCGYGRMGRQIIRDLQAREEPFVLVDSDEDLQDDLLKAKTPFITGDATTDDVLYSAGIERAQGVVAALNSDADNVMVVLTARELNPRAFIVARVARQETESKLRRAGADRVVNPYQIGGHRIALSLLRPAVHDFLDQIFHFGDGRNIDIGQIYVSANTHLEGLTIADSQLRSEHNVSILALREPTGQLIITPNPNNTIKRHAQLIVIGPPEAIYKLERDYTRS